MITFKENKTTPDTELKFPMLMRNYKTGDIVLFRSATSFVTMSPYTVNPESPIGTSYYITEINKDWEVYRGSIVLSNTSI